MKNTASHSTNSVGSVSAFMEKHYRHYNARETLSAAKAYKKFVEQDNGAMLVSLAGAMSTAELGISLAEMIRNKKIHAISCTAANLEEDLFNLFAHNEYKVIDNWRALSTQDEVDCVIVDTTELRTLVFPRR
jgi:deoxyhypusine synthase